MASDRFAQVISAIDAVNAGDPHSIEVDGVERPKELAHAELVTRWVQQLDPDASELQLIAARAHHLRRWALPRSDYPSGRKGYLRWRTELKKRHAAEVGELMAASGYDATGVERVQQIIEKRGLGSDPAVQTHEDALCLVFLSTQLDETAAKLESDDKTVEVLRKTAKKMSPDALEAAAGLPYSERGAALVERALKG